MQHLFLCGGMDTNFGAITAPFAERAGGARAHIALLFSGQPGWEPFVGRYRDPWLRQGAAEVTVVVPDPATGALSSDDMDVLRSATGIFMGGGDTRRYHQAYATEPVRSVIRERVRAGVPYGGMSAGALIATERCAIWGDRLTLPGNRLELRGSEEGCDAELHTGEGLGLAGGWLIEAHLTSAGGFGRLVAVIQQTGVPCGIGLDDSICLEVRDGAEALVHGAGRAYVLSAEGRGRFSVQVGDPGTRLTLPTGRPL